VINPLDPTLEIHYETPPILSEKDKNAAFLQR
jgi:dTDP-4-dehydrorhamnose 3,5-epimerase-like enzyme